MSDERVGYGMVDNDSHLWMRACLAPIPPPREVRVVCLLHVGALVTVMRMCAKLYGRARHVLSLPSERQYERAVTMKMALR